MLPNWLWLNPGSVVVALVSIYYLRLDVRYGLVLASYLAACLLGSQTLAAADTATWAGWCGGLFGVGWMFQFVGHYLEGRKPAFVDDLIGLLIGTLFVVAERGFMLGLRRDVHAHVTERAGALR